MWCVLPLTVSIAMCAVSSEASDTNKTHYAIIIDAGSSGSRALVFSWQEIYSSKFALPDFSQIHKASSAPGISEYVSRHGELRKYLADLLDDVRDTVPSAMRSETSICLMATAGLRLLSETDSNSVMNTINVLLLDKSFNPFHYVDGDSRVLSGEEEGVFTWITVNYLQKFFSSTEHDKRSTGITELGGASMQIAFEHNGSILAGKISQEIGGIYYRLYAHSYLTYGQEALVQWVEVYLIRGPGGNATTINNPCLIKDEKQTFNVDGLRNVTFIGTADAEGCLKILDLFVASAEPIHCFPKPCAIGDVYQPTVDQTEKFLAISAFYYTLKEINAIESDGVVVPSKIREKATEYCIKETYDQLLEERNRTHYNTNYCLTGLYISTLLTNGLKFPPNSRQVSTASKINGQSTDWTLGALICSYEMKRFSQPSETLENKIKRAKLDRRTANI